MAKEKKRIKKRKNAVFSFLISLTSLLIKIILVLIPLALGVFMYFNSPINTEIRLNYSDSDAIRIDEDGSYLIDVRRGETSQSVGMRLERNGLITNRYFWNLLCRFESEYLKTGTYRLNLPASMLSIHRLLTSGREVLHKVTVPEGVTLLKTSRIIEEAGICSAQEFLAAARDVSIIRSYNIPNNSMEGYLFPDTYFFPSGYPGELVVRKMADNFFKKMEEISPAFRNLSITELNNIVIMASIIEREYRVADEAPLISGVFNNRIRINMALQSCATVEYIITEIQGKPHPNQILFSDLEIVNPYNTYRNRGLPPGPISAPGVVALRAAVYPDRTNYLYFRVIDTSSGRHYFSRTYDEHIRAGLLYTPNLRHRP
ncbi:MAG: endolytic transglycosylase MltG [Treponema sp.]|nr:endolytic transglycosylase MltG [Treponema sp.]